MAQPHPDESDGIFLENELPSSKDEADYSLSVVNLTRAADIPLRYFLPKIFSPIEASMRRSCQRVSEKAPKYRLLNTDWGNRLSSIKEGPGILALVTVENKAVDQHTVSKVESHIKKLMKGTSCQLQRWEAQHILLHFEDSKDYETFGRLFLEEKLDDCEGFRVNAIEPSILTNPPRCFVEIETTQGTETRDTLMSFISYFSGAFKHVNILEVESLTPAGRSGGGEEPQDGDIPHMAITLMFSSQAQSRAAEVLKVLSAGDPWRPYRLPEPVAKELEDDNTTYFRHATLGLPLWGVKTGASESGVRLTLFVKEGSDFQQMEKFYGKVTGVSPLQQSRGTAVKRSTYPLSNRLEFTLALYQGLTPHAHENHLLYFQTNEQAIGAQKLAEDHWQLKDPENNTVLLFTTMK
ncbi:uncharacterized protein LOC110988125 [Acanthaster planci]|uniref:Uncharacterized protein LOC110988125 n=1 Tax=Acanthaster planci TaxID=133434 RepID=A0A8B7ZQB0_ACAPL|nr:uncharacterized protein LOC110988125 [Acanthaster planci]